MSDSALVVDPSTAAVPAPSAAASIAAASLGGWIVSPLYDSLLITLSPLLSMAVLIGICALGLAGPELLILSQVFVQAHLVIVFLRSHGNRAIYAQFPLRFTLVPLLLMAAVASSRRIALLVVVVGFFWDIYHTAQQTFGLSRIYDRLSGNRSDALRAADRVLNHLVYVGPIVAGVGFVANLKPFARLGGIGWTAFEQVPSIGEAWHAWLARGVVGFAIPFLAWYAWRTWQLHRQGIVPSAQKLALLFSTALTSVVMWGFFPIGAGLFVSNLFHGAQYFALVAHHERHTITGRMGRAPSARDFAITWLVLIVLGGVYGVWGALFVSHHGILSGYDSLGVRLAFAVSLSVSILHFWYDGFWSVRRNQV